jgi:hypothetical protein
MGDLRWPFRGAEALDAGAITARELRRFYAPVYPGVYVPRGVELSAPAILCCVAVVAATRSASGPVGVSALGYQVD